MYIAIFLFWWFQMNCFTAFQRVSGTLIIPVSTGSNQHFYILLQHFLNLLEMGNKIASFLFSTRLMAVLFIVFAASMAAGTFIEDAYNTDTARIWVYNAWWFELIMLFF